MKDTAKQLIDQLEAEKATREEASKALWRMSKREREEAMYKGELSGAQLYEWCKRAPEEVPLINNEFAFIATNTPEVAEASEHEPKRGDS